MQYIEPREVTIRVNDFVMDGVIEGSTDSFKYESSNTHFTYYFPSGEIDSLKINKKGLTIGQIEIVEACEHKINELLGIVVIFPKNCAQPKTKGCKTPPQNHPSSFLSA